MNLNSKWHFSCHINSPELSFPINNCEMLHSRLFPLTIARYHAKFGVRNYSKLVPGSVTHQVNPYSNIKITSNYHLNIKPYDLLDCPNGDLLRISLNPIKTEPSQNLPLDLENFIKNFNASVEIDNQNILIDTKDELNKRSTVHKLSNEVICVLEVPVKANLKIIAHRDVHVENLYSDDINIITSDGNISTKSIHSVNLNLCTENGNIRCEGSTLAHKMDARTYGDKDIYLHKILGDRLTAISENGVISTDSCYSENSKFITQKGELQLKNVHKQSELFVLDGGRLNVTGFHGILRAKTKGGILDFQLTEVYGNSYIEANDPIALNVNISEFVEQHTCLSINANEITIDSSLQHFKDSQTLSDKGKKLEIGNSDLIEDNLTIRTNGHLNLGKMSWMDTIKLKISAPTEITKK